MVHYITHHFLPDQKLVLDLSNQAKPMLVTVYMTMRNYIVRYIILSGYKEWRDARRFSPEEQKSSV